MTAVTVAVPKITDDMATLDVAYAYVKAGLYIGPCKRGTKDPGSVLGKSWQIKTSRDTQVITSWFVGTDHGIFIHAGRSGLWIADVDDPAKIHPKLQQAITELEPPYQATRTDQSGRGHYLFLRPPGRDFGNGLGQLANGWGEGRSRNGVIIVAPSEHQKHQEGGCYQWGRTGAVPVLPDYVADLLPDALDATEAATDAEVEAFLGVHRGSERPELLDVQIAAWQKEIAAGESRHGTVMGRIAGAMKEARAGLVDAQLAADTFQSVFEPAVMADPIGPKQGKARSLPAARDEWRGILAWAVAQGLASDTAATRERVDKEVARQFEEVSADQFVLPPKAPTNGHSKVRRIDLTWADTITPKPVRWAWIYLDQGRIPAGSLSIAAGREGCGKSQFAIWLAAQITKGILTGVLAGKPRRVIVVATEDSWQHTIVPRLIAAGADLSLVARADVVTEGDNKMVISLPPDMSLLEATIKEYEVALMILDPMLSVITNKLDSYRAHDMRTALEPLVTAADRTGCLMLGIAHFNKGSGTDAATLLSGSHAFRDVPRALFGFVATKTERVLSQIKNSLGRDDLPSFTYTIEPFTVPTPEGDADVSKFVLGGVSHRDVADILADGNDGEDSDIRNAAQEFLLSYLVSNNLAAPASKAIAAGIANGFTADQMKNARARMRDPKVISGKPSFGTGWEWRIETANDN
jgi:hypothetical protein